MIAPKIFQPPASCRSPSSSSSCPHFEPELKAKAEVEEAAEAAEEEVEEEVDVEVEAEEEAEEDATFARDVGDSGTVSIFHSFSHGQPAP